MQACITTRRSRHGRDGSSSAGKTAKSTSKFWLYLLTFNGMVKKLDVDEHNTCKRRYKYIYYHKSSKTWQAVLRGRPAVPCNPDQEVVVAAAAKAWKVSVESLMLTDCMHQPHAEIPPRQQFKYVTWHSNRKLWIVQKKGTYIGCSTELDTAVKMACQHGRVHQDALRLKTPKRTGANSTDRCQRFAILWRVYRGKNKNTPMVPCDLQDLLHRAPTSRILTDPRARGLIFPFLMSKFPEHRDAVEKSMKVSRGQSSVKNTYESLVKAAEAISTLAHPEQEVRNVGRGNMHHMTFSMLISRSLKLMHKTKANQCKELAKSKLLLMGKNQSAYKVSPLNATLHRNLLTWVNFGEALDAAQTPQTCEDWGKEVVRLSAVMRGKSKRDGTRLQAVVGCRGDYCGLWTIRSYLIYRMRRDHIQRLKVGHINVRSFMTMFPDQKQQVLEMSGGKWMTHRKVADVFADAGCPIYI